MFCYQCEQTAKGQGCTTKGVCGKDHDTATLQDLLVYALKGISQYMHRAGKLGAHDHAIDVFTVEALFSTLTNVDFDPDRLVEYLGKAGGHRDRARALYEDAAKKAGQKPEDLSGPAQFSL
ncbi:MAG: hydroxylamine reductase, partial [bacterium]